MTTYTQTFTKDPASIKDYQVDWTDWLGSDAIASSAWSVPPGIVNRDDDFEGGCTLIWLGSGTRSKDYECVNTITTTGGRTEVAMLKIQVR